MSDATSVAAAQDNTCSASRTKCDDPYVLSGTFANSSRSIKDKMCSRSLPGKVPPRMSAPISMLSSVLRSVRLDS